MARPLPVITDCVRTSIEGTMPNGRHWANVMHFGKPPATSYASAISQLDAAIPPLWTTNLGGGNKLTQFLSTAWKIDRIRYTPLDGSTATTVIGHTIPGIQAANDPLPASVALVFTAYTAKRGRRHRGRTYLCGWAEDANNPAGALLSTYQVLLQSQLTGWFNTFTPTTIFPVIASYGYSVLKNGTISTWPPDKEPVTSFVLNGIWDTQRRRNRP